MFIQKVNSNNTENGLPYKRFIQFIKLYYHTPTTIKFRHTLSTKALCISGWIDMSTVNNRPRITVDRTSNIKTNYVII